MTTTTLLRLKLALLAATVSGYYVQIQSHTPPQPSRSCPPVMVKELTKASWCENVDGANELAVVFFYANWCRNCKAVTPIFKRMEREYRSADFYKVNFKAESELCYNERVFSFPTVHFYLPGVGRVGRCVLTAKEAEPRLRAGLTRFLGSNEGAPSQLQLLKQLRTEVLRPIVRYKDLVSALRGLADMQALSSAAPNRAMAGLRDAVEKDEERLEQLESLFGMLDRDSDGRLSAAEVEQAVATLRPPGASALGDGGGGGASSSGQEELLERLRAQQRDGRSAEVDLATFVRLMITKAVADYTAPDEELLPAFEALDADGDGTISREEMLSTIESFCRALPEAEGCDVDPRAVLPLAFDAFANDDQLLDYERFVELVSSSLQPLECVIEDEKPDYSSVLGMY